MTEHENWEQETIKRLAESSLKEQRRARNWGIFFKLAVLIYFVVILVIATRDPVQIASTKSRHTALIDIKGLIVEGEKSSADNIVTALRKAFENSKSAGIIVRINSPGGTPVQAGYIYDEIKRLRQLNPDKPLYAVISDICASGGYYVAAAADEIYANQSSIVGSIGVRLDSFGFVEAMDKLGVERRTLTAGKHKALLDPFAPVDKTAKQSMQTMINDVHQHFINAVIEGRGDRLVQDTQGLFSGLVWSGERSIEVGLVDQLASAGYVAREVIGAENIVNYTVKDDLLDRLAGRVGASMASVFGKQLLAPTLN